MAASALYTDIKSILEQAKANAVRAVNFSMVVAYWEIGKRIVEEQQQGEERARYGGAVLKEIAKKLTSDFGKGFNVDNLENFRKFYLVFTAKPISDAVRRKLENETLTSNFELKQEESMTTPISSALRRKLEDENSTYSIRDALRNELSWTHYRLLMRVENEEARKYYMNEAAAQNWSTRTLERQINSLYFERLLSSKNKKALFQQTEKEAARDKPSIFDFVKDPYVLEFLQLQPNATL